MTPEMKSNLDEVTHDAIALHGLLEGLAILVHERNQTIDASPLANAAGFLADDLTEKAYRLAGKIALVNVPKR